MAACYDSRCKWSNLGHFSAQARKIKKNYPGEIPYISPRKNSLHISRKKLSGPSPKKVALTFWMTADQAVK